MTQELEVAHQIRAAFNEDNAEEFQRLLRDHPEFIRNPDGTDRWMWQAAMDGKLRIIQALVQLGMHVNESSEREDPEDPDNPFYQAEGPIVQAAGEGHLEVVRWLLEQGAKINYVVHGKRRCLPLEWAAKDGHLNVVKLLVEHGAHIDATWNGSNPITLAEDYGQWAVRDYLHALGARSMRERTPPDYPRSHKRFLKQHTEQRGPLGSWRLEIPGDPLVVLHVIPANELCDVHTLFTLGLSDRPLPQGRDEFACTELRCMLPRDWPLTEAALQDPRWNWPVVWLKRLVGELRAAPRWPEVPAIFMNGEPPAPLSPETRLCGWLCLKSLGESVHAPDYRWIDIHSLFPIYDEERALIRQMGYEELIERFEAGEVPLYIDPQRPNMTEK